MTSSSAAQNPPPTHHLEAHALRARLNRLARILDSGIGVPGTRWRFGVDGLIGLVPVIGDLFGLLMGAYFLFEGARIGAPARLQLRMLGNVVFDALIGLVPVIGDLADFAFKSNQRNAQLLDRHLDRLLTPSPSPQRARRSWRWVAAVAALALLGIAVAIGLRG
jgi:hypothetical protein